VKRNLVLLTAVVLAAVILSGCVIWPFGVAVTYELEEDVFAAHKNPGRISKNAVDFVAEFTFKAADETRSWEDFAITAVDKDKKDLKPVATELMKEDTKVGIKVTIAAAGSKDFTIAIKNPPVAE